MERPSPVRRQIIFLSLACVLFSLGAVFAIGIFCILDAPHYIKCLVDHHDRIPQSIRTFIWVAEAISGAPFKDAWIALGVACLRMMLILAVIFSPFIWRYAHAPSLEKKLGALQGMRIILLIVMAATVADYLLYLFRAPCI